MITHLKWGQSRTDNLDGTKPARAQVDEVELERRPTPRHVKRSTQVRTAVGGRSKSSADCGEVESAEVEGGRRADRPNQRLSSAPGCTPLY